LPAVALAAIGADHDRGVGERIEADNLVGIRCAAVPTLKKRMRFANLWLELRCLDHRSSTSWFVLKSSTRSTGLPPSAIQRANVSPGTRTIHHATSVPPDDRNAFHTTRPDSIAAVSRA
jgi:hypothetical protein